MKPTLMLGLAAIVLSTCAAAAFSQGTGEAATIAVDAAQVEFFERHVRPTLAEHCFACHGPKKQEAGLRLDTRAGLLAGGDSGLVVDPSDPPASRLLKAISYENSDLEMPPTGKMPAAAIAALATWVKQGAFWPANDSGPTVATVSAAANHWAFAPIRPQAIPSVREGAWPLAPIDHFVLARLEAEGMAPSPGADRATLIRRATFDLIGLPPSAEETAAFVGDQSPGAFAKVVDRLLESPHYGERWGRYWLDVARYADTKGYVRLQEERRFYCAFTYRDYVIRAFNEDLPFDRFVIEQLAADQLPPGGDNRSLAALGFLALGRQFTGNKHDIVDDRIDVVSRGLLGLTVSCARCHDHKYDPIPTADYHSLYGVFSSCEEPVVPTPLGKPASDAATVEFERELATRWQAFAEYEAQQHAALVDTFRARSADYLVKALAGREPPQQPLPKDADEIRQIIVERWIEHLERTGADHPVFRPWHAFSALKPEHFAADAATIIANGSSPAAKDPAPRINAGVKRYFSEHPPQSMAEVARGYGDLLAETHRRWQAQLVSTAAAGAGALARFDDADAEELRQVLYAVDSPVAVRPLEALGEYLYDAPINNEIVKRRNAVHQHLSQTAIAPPRAHTLTELPTPCEPRIFSRGNPTRPGRLVPRQFLKVLSPADRRPFTVGGGRLELARAIVSRDNPLTARVAVNRVWAHHFGAGLVRSPSNFGLRGEAPTHPELLDYLAQRFMDEGWSIKQLHRGIMLSRTYQQSSRDRTDCRLRDPENRLLSHASRRRLDFEALRDTLLLVAGRLDRTLGGPSVDLTAPMANRRSVYGLVDRQGLPGMLPTFDFASPDAHSPQRYTTTVPQQALFLMNSPLATELARSFAGRTDLKDIADPAARVASMIRAAWGRPATEEEIKLAVDFLSRDAQTAPAAGALDAWQALAQTLLLANEFSYVD